MDKYLKLINECIVLSIEELRKNLKTLPFTDQQKDICECIEILSRAFKEANSINTKENEDV